PSDYLSYISTVYGAPLFMVRGNHDGKKSDEDLFGENLHRRLVKYGGFKFLGFEGCPKYSPGGIQYTESEMGFYVQQAIINSWFRGKPDVIVTHATPQGIHEGSDYPHRGFPAFNQLIQRLKPRYFLHGHNHLSYSPLKQERVEKSGETLVINVSGYYVFDLD
ncbi:MAG TPA: metallophosphoesterase, partial [Bacillota bacterium]|nr:metallophosphoesterase [Bacillota bacterium]